jgi:hypothetical protein
MFLVELIQDLGTLKCGADPLDENGCFGGRAGGSGERDAGAHKASNGECQFGSASARLCRERRGFLLSVCRIVQGPVEDHSFSNLTTQAGWQLASRLCAAVFRNSVLLRKAACGINMDRRSRGWFRSRLSHGARMQAP